MKRNFFRHATRVLLVIVCLSLTAVLAADAPGWTVVSGKAAASANGQSAEGAAALVMRAPQPSAPPVEGVFRFRLESGGLVTFAANQEGQKDALLTAMFRRAATGGNHLSIGVASSGKPMATVAISSRGWNSIDKLSGAADYGWRFDRVRNLWDDRDRAEIGSDFARLTPFNDKIFVARLVVTTTSRQVWIDDRMVAEDVTPTGGPVVFSMSVGKGATVVSQAVEARTEYGKYLPLHLDNYESNGKPAPEGAVTTAGPAKVPVRALAAGAKDIDLSSSVWRYRLTHGTGPEAPYVNARRAWPTPLEIDPAEASLRVPYRDYQNAWLVVWLDEKPGTIPCGSVSFFRDTAGYAAQSDFEITPEAIAKKLVVPLDKNAAGKQQYLVRVPLNQQGLYGMIDLAGQFLDFEVTKPLHLVRSYPDPIYYGRHPGGEASSVHVTGITLEESPFGFEVKPEQFGNVFEQPAPVAYKIAVTNHTPEPLKATVKLETTSYDGSETTAADAVSPSIAPGQSVDVPITLKPKTFGWHSLKATVVAGDVTKQVELSLVVLPPNKRTYGDSANEIRFGAWPLFGHYSPLTPGHAAENEPILAMLRKLGIRRIGFHGAYIDKDIARKLDFFPNGPHTLNDVYHRLNENDPEALAKTVAGEVATMEPLTKIWPAASYYYGGEWGFDHTYSHTTNPRYTGKGPYVFSEDSKKKLDRQIKIFEAVGKALREKTPAAKLILQWGSPLHEVAFMDAGFPKNLVDGFGMDAPMFELMPETPVAVGSINYLWVVRSEAQRLGWPRLPINWCEGPFFPAFEGALSEREQEQNHIRYWLLGMAYGIEAFEAGMVPFDNANYYGAEHYGTGVFRRVAYTCPKPAVAAIATATTMVCGADVVGPVDTGTLNNYCLAFKNAKTGAMTYALWRVNGTAEATLTVAGTGDALVTDAMGNAKPVAIKDGKAIIKLSPSPVWLTNAGEVKGFAIGTPVYVEAPAKITRPLTAFSADKWAYKGDEDLAYANNHFGLTRVTDNNLGVTFAAKDDGHDNTANVTLAQEPAGERPLALRYGQIVLKQPAVIPGKAQALGVWVKGNAGWGRIAYQLRDAKGELWTSIGTSNDWNCDDPYGWARVNFEGWRYLRFPLPGNRPFDAARELESTWWKSEKGDGIVDYPLSLERVFVEATNETLVLGQLKPIAERTYKLSGLVAEYASEKDTTEAVIARHKYRANPEWTGPAENLMATLREKGVGDAPKIKAFEEPGHWNDGRQMVLRVDGAESAKYSLYLSRYPDGRGAEKLAGTFKDKSTVVGLRPGITMYLFMTAISADGKSESKPSEGFKLVTEDKFAEK